MESSDGARASARMEFFFLELSARRTTIEIVVVVVAVAKQAGHIRE